MPRIYKSHHLRRRHARKLFGKKAVRAIKAIAQKPVETKWFQIDNNISASPVGPVAWSGNSAIIGHNIWNNVPRADSIATRSRSEMIGQECMARGFSIKWAIFYPGIVLDGDLWPMLKVRVSVLKCADYFPFNSASGWEIISPTAQFWDDEDGNNSPPTMVRFNTDVVKVLKVKTFTLSPGGQRGMLSEGKMWVPFRNKITAADPEPVVGTGSFIGKIKGWQYYCFIELFDPSGLEAIGSISSNWFFVANTRVYFKDA